MRHTHAILAVILLSFSAVYAYAQRSSQWHSLRDRYVSEHPVCDRDMHIYRTHRPMVSRCGACRAACRNYALHQWRCLRHGDNDLRRYWAKHGRGEAVYDGQL